MDPHAMKFLVDRMDRMEDKLDVLIEFRWKILGMASLGGGLFGFIVALATIYVGYK